MFISYLILLKLLLAPATHSLTGAQVVANSIEFHDPENRWSSLQAHLEFTETRPNAANRYSSIDIDNVRGNFCLNREVKKMHVQRHIVQDSCFYNIDEYEQLTDKEFEEYKLTDKRSFFMRNYYLYLWGLPMKLTDAGTHIDNTVTKATFDNQQALEVRVWYDEATGSDIWYFYFNPENYAMIGYRFYHDETKGDGEYITLKDSELVFGINMPKERTWYTHQDSTLLGTDILSSFSELKHQHY